MNDLPEKRPPRNPSDRFAQRSQLLLDMGRYAEALQELLRWIAIEPENPRAHAKLGYCFSRMDRYDEAIEHGRIAVALQPDRCDFHLNLGICFFNAEQYESAHESLQTALQFSPESYVAHDRMARTYLRLKKPEPASRHADKALELQPTASGALLLKGRTLISLGKYQEALGVLREALRYNAEESDAHYFMGVCYSSLGLREHARARYLETLRICPVDSDAQEKLAKLDEVSLPRNASPFEWWAVSVRLYVNGLKWLLTQTTTYVLMSWLLIAYCIAYFCWREMDWVAWTLSIAPLVPTYLISDVVIIPLTCALFPTQSLMTQYPRWKRVPLRLLGLALLGIWSVAAWGIAAGDGSIFGIALTAAYVYLAVAQYVLVEQPKVASQSARIALCVVMLAMCLAFFVFVIDFGVETWQAGLVENAIGWLVVIGWCRRIATIGDETTAEETSESSADSGE
ncbi:tetratricopeptide repeat protein [Blastopirellula retiformator]|nr:tetratricopeptide repeat protein [Blastopirellula retiformator]